MRSLKYQLAMSMCALQLLAWLSPLSRSHTLPMHVLSGVDDMCKDSEETIDFEIEAMQRDTLATYSLSQRKIKIVPDVWWGEERKKQEAEMLQQIYDDPNNAETRNIFVKHILEKVSRKLQSGGAPKCWKRKVREEALKNINCDTFETKEACEQCEEGSESQCMWMPVDKVKLALDLRQYAAVFRSVNGEEGLEPCPLSPSHSQDDGEFVSGQGQDGGAADSTNRGRQFRRFDDHSDQGSLQPSKAHETHLSLEKCIPFLTEAEEKSGAYPLLHVDYTAYYTASAHEAKTKDFHHTPIPSLLNSKRYAVRGEKTAGTGMLRAQTHTAQLNEIESDEIIGLFNIWGLLPLPSELASLAEESSSSKEAIWPLGFLVASDPQNVADHTCDFATKATNRPIIQYVKDMKVGDVYLFESAECMHCGLQCGSPGACRMSFDLRVYLYTKAGQNGEYTLERAAASKASSHSGQYFGGGGGGLEWDDDGDDGDGFFV